MALGKSHEIHQRRFGRNLGVGVVLGLFVALIFGLTIAKVGTGGLGRAFNQPPASIDAGNAAP